VTAPEPAQPVNLADYADRAAQVMDDNARAYIDGGAGDETTLRDNLAAWSGLRLCPRVLRDLAGGHTRVDLLGRTLDHPLLLAPVAYQRLVHPDGEAATALAAAAQGAGLVLSAQSSVPLERVAGLVRDDAGRGPLWFQLVLPHDRGFARDLLARVEAAGFEALVLTVDAPVNGVRDRERRARFTLPPGVRAVNLDGLAPPPTVGAGSVFAQWMAQAATWADVDWLLQQTRLPVLLKGVLHADDARRAVAQGAAGVIVSNHGGRTLDGALATADALPPVVQAVAGQVPVLVDGGIRRGVDVLRACALGARAVLIGRPQVHALAVGGPHGVAHLLRLLRDELEVAMALCGCATLAQAGSALCLPARSVAIP
jgi:4-hydroxymandelate oxidase